MDSRNDVDFAEYVMARGAHLVKVATLLTGDAALGEDLAQDVLSRAMLSWRRISASGNVDAYLRRSLVNARTSWWRRQQRPAVSVTEAGSDLADRVVHRDAILQALARLPRRQRAAIVLRYYEDLPDAEIADLLGCSASTVRVHCHKAMPTLRHLLHDSFSERRCE